MVVVRDETATAHRRRRVDALVDRIVFGAVLSPRASALLAALADEGTPEERLASLARITLAEPPAGDALSPESTPSNAFADLTAADAPHLTILLVRALVAELNRLFPPGGALDREAFWRHSLATAWTARELAVQTGQPSKAWSAFLAGLLLRVGQLAFETHAPKTYARALRRAASAPAGATLVEAELLGVDHRVVGRRLAESWRLPPALCACLAPDETQDASACDHGSLASVLTTAEQLAAQAGFKNPAISLFHGAAVSMIAADGHASLQSRIAPAVERLFAALQPSQSPPLQPADRRIEQAHRRCSRALQNFAQAASPNGDVAATCSALATAARDAFSPSAVVVLALSDVGDHALGAVAITASAAVRIFPMTGLNLCREVCLGADRLPPDALLELPPSVARYVAAAAGLDEIANLALALRSAGTWVGALLLVAPASGAGLADLAAGDQALLANTWGYALACASERDRRARDVDHLLITHRRSIADGRSASAAASLGMMAEMSAGAAHELNNPLAVIAGRAQLLLRNVTDDRIRRDLTIIDEHARRASNIVSELLDYAKPAPPQPRTFAARRWAEGVRQHWECNSSLRPGQLQVEIADPRLTIHADETQITDAVHAIIANAIEACRPENMHLRINSESIASDDTMVVSIGDNGRGMSPEVLAHACDPFFSHRPAGRGRGLGLSRAARLVELNAGRLWLDSRPESGTTVCIALPTRAS